MSTTTARGTKVSTLDDLPDAGCARAARVQPPGSVVLWSNCHTPLLRQQPFPETATKNRDTWVGDLWPFFRAGHVVEMNNLKKILEHRQRTGETIRPWTIESWRRDV